MGITTEEIEIPAGLQMPAGMPRHRRDAISEITNFDRYAGDRSRLVWIGAGAGLLAFGMYAVFGGSSGPEPELQAAPAAVVAPKKKVLVEPSLPEVAEEEEIEAPPDRKLVGSGTITPIEKGTLVVESHPRLGVYLGKQRLGRTPLEVKVDAGLHELKLVNRKSFLEVTRKVRIRADKTRKLDFHFGMSKLNVKAPDGTKVYLDRRFVGKTPIDSLRIAEGRHHLKLVHGGQKHAERLNVPPGGTVDYVARF